MSSLLAGAMYNHTKELSSSLNMYCTECNELIIKNIFKPCECNIFLHQDCVKNYVNRNDSLIVKECRDCGFAYKYNYYSRYHEILYNLNNLIYNNYKYKILGIVVCNLILLFYANLWIVTLTLNISIFMDLIFIAVCSYYINSITQRYTKKYNMRVYCKFCIDVYIYGIIIHTFPFVLTKTLRKKVYSNLSSVYRSKAALVVVPTLNLSKYCG